VPPTCFYPQPSVDSTVIRLDSAPPPPIAPAHFFPLVHKAFQQRRKMLTTSLPIDKTTLQSILQTLGIRPDARPEALSFPEWIALAQNITLSN
jgi:16S rRNA (adenine1518-N6/adenine1519-N6)-dimethyltransferase